MGSGDAAITGDEMRRCQHRRQRRHIIALYVQSSVVYPARNYIGPRAIGKRGESVCGFAGENSPRQHAEVSIDDSERRRRSYRSALEHDVAGVSGEGIDPDDVSSGSRAA